MRTVSAVWPHLPHLPVRLMFPTGLASPSFVHRSCAQTWHRRVSTLWGRRVPQGLGDAGGRRRAILVTAWQAGILSLSYEDMAIWLDVLIRLDHVGLWQHAAVLSGAANGAASEQQTEHRLRDSMAAGCIFKFQTQFELMLPERWSDGPWRAGLDTAIARSQAQQRTHGSMVPPQVHPSRRKHGISFQGFWGRPWRAADRGRIPSLCGTPQARCRAGPPGVNFAPCSMLSDGIDICKAGRWTPQ